MFTIGVLYSGILGALVSTWRWISVYCMIWCFIWAILLLIFCPETPLYFLRKENYDGARKSLYFLRGHELIDMEIASILINLEDDEENRFEISHLLKPYYLKPLGICLVIMIGQQMCGYNAVIFFR